VLPNGFNHRRFPEILISGDDGRIAEDCSGCNEAVSRVINDF
jgi:hypothetical protein